MARFWRGGVGAAKRFCRSFPRTTLCKRLYRPEDDGGLDARGCRNPRSWTVVRLPVLWLPVGPACRADLAAGAACSWAVAWQVNSGVCFPRRLTSACRSRCRLLTRRSSHAESCLPAASKWCRSEKRAITAAGGPATAVTTELVSVGTCWSAYSRPPRRSKRSSLWPGHLLAGNRDRNPCWCPFRQPPRSDA